MKKWLWLAALIGWVCVSPALADHAQGIRAEHIAEAGGKLETIRYEFAGELPEVVRNQLAQHGLADAICIQGLALERKVLVTPPGQENASRGSDALLLMEQNGERQLVGLIWNADRDISRISLLGSMGLSSHAELFFTPGALRMLHYTLRDGHTWTFTTANGQWIVVSCNEVQ